LDEIVLAYATTIHKIQGSEYPAVVIPLTIQHYPMLQRNLLYTAVTRGKRLVVIIGQKRAMAMPSRASTPGGGGRNYGSGSWKHPGRWAQRSRPELALFANKVMLGGGLKCPLSKGGADMTLPP
jgi:exodeoxyribonuclease V alpha subunit